MNNEEPIYNKLQAIGDRNLKSYVKGDLRNAKFLKEIASEISPLASAKAREYGDRRFGLSKDLRYLLAN